MEVLQIILYLTVIAKAFAFHFGNIIQTLPKEFPEDFKMKILDMYLKDPQVFGDADPRCVKDKVENTSKTQTVTEVPNLLRNAVTTEAKSTTKKKMNHRRTKIREPNKAIKIEMVTKITKYLRLDDNTSELIDTTTESTITNEIVTESVVTKEMITQETLSKQPVTQETVAETPTTKTTNKSSPSIPLMTFSLMPMPPMPIPIPFPIYPQLPLIIPMRAYFEPVKHDHPPLYKIKEFIKEDNERWARIKHKQEKNCRYHSASSNIDESNNNWSWEYKSDIFLDE